MPGHVRHLTAADTATRYLGIDPGVTGAVACLWSGWPHGAGVHDAPVVRIGTKGRKHAFDISGMRQLLVDLLAGPEPCCAIIEAVHGWPGMATQTMTSLVRGAALWEGLCAGLAIPVHRVSPQAWKRHHGLLKSDKGASRVVAAQHFPLHDLGPKTHTGRADALLIASYGRAMNF